MARYLICLYHCQVPGSPVTRRALDIQIRKSVGVNGPRKENLCSFNEPKGSTLSTFPPSDNI